MLSYDNFRSYSAKGDLIKNGKLRGFAMWEAGGDSVTHKDLLLDAIRTAAGLNDEDEGGNGTGVTATVSVGATVSVSVSVGVPGATVTAIAGTGGDDGDDDSCLL
jgi:GH18 family chitinase